MANIYVIFEIKNPKPLNTVSGCYGLINETPFLQGGGIMFLGSLIKRCRLIEPNQISM